MEENEATQSRARKARWARRALVIVLVVVAVLVAAAALWLGDYYHADSTALAAMADEDGPADGVTVRAIDGDMTAFIPEDPVCGLIFYPGAKVQAESYAPLLEQCAERGVLCVLVKPPLNLSILSADAASGVQAQFPDVKRWLIGGHSMGGVAATDYLSRHEDDFAGIVLLASYPASDLSDFEGTALSIVGTRDGVINRTNYEAAREKLPADARELQIDEGNHAYYGNYGDQEGDGEAGITREQQQALVTDAIAAIAANPE